MGGVTIGDGWGDHRRHNMFCYEGTLQNPKMYT